MGTHRDRLAAGPACGQSELAMSRIKLAEPIEIVKFWKNRKGDAVVVSLSTFEGRNLVNVRQHFTSKDGKLLPTSKGLAMQVLRLPELVKAVEKALSKAREIGLLDGEGSE
jgi:hypothetical protein